ncbi:putative protein [BD1-7 clade bacterium]|uniref:Metallo-beta-lactamase domain-containing protein n=1 Tax=BD1-7 clade bacterium TaxID=2029982 RepID=A0A5S9QZM7_9GAMM|nr:putative protein [BD1-7 clade bacterium]
MPIEIQFLGQVGCVITTPKCRVMVDPYLSNAVAETESEDLVRRVPIPPISTTAAAVDAVFITHNHLDHCDPETLHLIASLNENVPIFGPPSVINRLDKFPQNQHLNLKKLTRNFFVFGDIDVSILPSAHPIIRENAEGLWATVGYLFNVAGRKIYHSGDTSLCQALIDHLKAHAPIDIGLIPVNECNFMRDASGILGNMSVREAFYLCDTVGIDRLIPTHWDMFDANCVYPEEISLLYRMISPSFELSVIEAGQSIHLDTQKAGSQTCLSAS